MKEKYLFHQIKRNLNFERQANENKKCNQIKMKITSTKYEKIFDLTFYVFELVK